MKNQQPTLISFLGKSYASEEGYREATYQIEDFECTTAYSAFALSQHINPKKIIILGTSGSMWDVLIEAHATGSKEEDSRLKLMDLASKNKVDNAILQKLTPIIEASLQRPVEMKIIPYAKTNKEQIRILSSIADSINEKETVVMDVTHGFRHLPMLGLLASHYLERIKQVNIEGIYYGALEMTEAGKTPMLNLSGLLETMNWIQAITAYDASGNYGYFADLLEKSGWSKNEADNLRQAAFFERTNNISKTKEKLSTINKALEKRDGAFLKLFGDVLQQRLSWWKKGGRADWEHSLAKRYFNRRDYLRSSVFLQEASISNKLSKEEQNEYKAREKNCTSMIALRKKSLFNQLRVMRNGMVHGIRGEAAFSLKKEATLRDTLVDMLKNWKILDK